jgi:uncharacterized protein (TIGR02145 family)
MKIGNIKFILLIISVALTQCKTEEIILHGEISGTVTDTLTGQPLPAVAVKLNPVNDTTSTGIDGKYVFKSLLPGNYEIEASKQAFTNVTKNITVSSAKTSEINFALEEIPVIYFSKPDLDFEIDLISLSFTITKTGQGKLGYTLAPSKEWISVNPISGDLDKETDTITVTINRSGLDHNFIKEWISFNYSFHQYNLQDTVGVYLNGVLDQDKNYYKIAKIGSQTWMAENLNTGREIALSSEPQNNGIVEKWCYNCGVYGGLYLWDEVVQYHPEGVTPGLTQGICPVGWHIPTVPECIILMDYLGGGLNALPKLKATTSWDLPNNGTNESGFNALAGGNRYNKEIVYIGYRFFIHLADPDKQDRLGGFFRIEGSDVIAAQVGGLGNGLSVRCIKDPGKK